MTNGRRLTTFERELWAVQSAAPESTPYNLCMAFELRGRLDERALAAAIDRVIARHVALRSTFPSVAGSPWCVATAATPVLPATIPVEAGRLERARELFERWTAEPFDLARGPLFRARLIRLAAEHHVIAVGAHHIVADGASMETIWKEVLGDYEALAVGTRPPAGHQGRLPSREVRASPPSEDAEELERYWAGRLATLGPARALSPVDGTPSTGEPAVAELSCGGEIGHKCRAMAREERTSSFVILLTAFMVFLLRRTEAFPIAVATPVDARFDIPSEAVVGLHINLVPIITDINYAEPFRMAVRRTRRAFLQDLAHAALPFGKIAELAGAISVPGRHDLAQATFQIANSRRTTECAGLKIRDFTLSPAVLARFPPAARRRTSGDFAVQVWMRDDAVLSGTLRASGHISHNAARLAADFSVTVSDLLSAPDAALGAAPGLVTTDQW